VDDAQIGSTGRTVRCAKCRHSWYQDPPEEILEQVAFVEPPAEPAPIPKGSNLPALARKQKRKSGAQTVGWVGFLLTVAVIIGGGYFARHQIVEAWPPSARLFTLVDPSIPFPYTPATAKADKTLPQKAPQPVGTGLKFFDIQTAYEEVDKKQVLVVSGVIRNLSKTDRDVPRIRISLVDANQKEIHFWIVTADKSALPPGQEATFRTRLVDPPARLAGLNAKFIGSDEAAVSQN
jgi:hypothetical protein